MKDFFNTWIWLYIFVANCMYKMYFPYNNI